MGLNADYKRLKPYNDSETYPHPYLYASTAEVVAAAAAPKFSVDDTSALVYDKDNLVSVTISSEGALVYYSTDGGSTWSTGDIDSATITLTDDTDIQAYAVLYDASSLEAIEGSESATVTKSYKYQACSFTISHDSSSYPENTTVTITPTPSDATITWLYEDSGEGSTGDSSTLTLTDSGELTVKVTKDGYKPAEDTYTYTVTKSCAAPTFDVTVDSQTGYATVAVGATVTISTATTGATIQYRLSEDGEWITGNQVEVTDDCIIYVQITKDGYTTATGSIKVTVQVCEAPAFSAKGAVAEGTEVTITCATDDATIYYKKDDAEDWTEYTSPIAITEACTLKAYATATGYKASSTATASYTIKVPVDGAVFVPVTSTADINTDGQYILVGFRDEVAYVMASQSANTANNNVSGLEYDENVYIYSATEPQIQVVDADKVGVLTLQAAENGKFYIISGDYKLQGGHSANNNKLAYITGDSNAATITLEDDGNIKIVFDEVTNGRGYLRYNNTLADKSAGTYNNTFNAYSSTSTTGDLPYLYINTSTQVAPTQCGNVVATPGAINSTVTVTKDQTVALSCATEGAEIKYQIKKASDDDYSAEATYSEPIAITEDFSLKAWAVDPNAVLENGNVCEYAYTVAQLDAPSITASSMFSSEMEVEITHDGEDVTIYYTTDGWETTQSGASPVAFTVTTTTTVEAYAAHANYVDSEKVSATYTYKERRTFAHTTEVWTGVDYVIMSSDAGASSFYLMGPEDTDNSRITALSSSDFELSDNKLEVTIEPTVDYQIVRFENNGDGTYYMYSVNYGKYFNGAGKGKAGFSADPEAVTIDCTTAQTNVTDMYWAKIIWQGTDHTGYYLQKNDQNMFFGCYENTQRNLYLYIDAASASKVMDPKFYKSDCTVPLGFSMNVTCGTPDASIEWTFTDAEGNALNITPWYVDGEGWYFTVSEAMTVTAKGVKEGLDDSEVISTTYNVIDLAAEPRYFKRVASMDDIEEGIANNREFIVGAYSRFYLSQEGAARPGLMSIAEKAQTSETFKLWAAPKQSTTWGVTNFVLIGEENGKVDDGDDEIQVNNNGIMAMRSADATDDDFKSLAFITIEHYTGEDRKDFKNHEIDSSVQLYTFKIGDKYLNGSTGQGSGNNTLYWSDEQVPMMLSMITSTEDIPETQDYLVDRMLCQWIKTTDDRETEYKCLKYNYGTDISVYGSYQHSNTGNDQVYPFIYVEEDYESVKCPEPLYKEFDTQQENNYTYNITFKDEKEIPAYIWVYMEGQESKCTDTPASSDSGSSETSKRPKAVSYDNDHAVISVTVNLHGKHEGGVHTFTSKVGEPVKVPIYVTSTVKATAAYDGYLASRSGEAINEVSVLDQTPTGIVEVGVDEIETGARVFNLQGQMLPRPVKGQVVIVAPLSAPAYKALLR